MKTSLVLFTAAVAIPVLITVGVSTAMAFGIASVIGVGAMFVQDYGQPPLRDYVHSTEVPAQKSDEANEHHPLAA